VDRLSIFSQVVTTANTLERSFIFDISVFGTGLGVTRFQVRQLTKRWRPVVQQAAPTVGKLAHFSVIDVVALTT